MDVKSADESDGALGSPMPPLALIEAGLDDIRAVVRYAECAASTHTVVHVRGLEDVRVTKAMGRVLVGALAGAVKCDTSLAAALLVTGVEARQALTDHVVKLLHASNSFPDKAAILFRDTKRNAWLAEGVLHTLLVAQNREPTVCLRGPVHALRQLHPIPTQQGLDAVALYIRDSNLMIAVGESKASRTGGSGALTESAQIFKSIDEGDHTLHLRQELSALAGSLPAHLADEVSNAVLDRRCYVPSIVHEVQFDPHAAREVLGRLIPPTDRKRVLIMQLQDFHRFFDDVADAMRAAVPEVVI